MILPEVTTRAVVDVGRKCNAQCKFCYHSHLGDLSKQTFESEEYLRKEIDNAFKRGCDYIDFTGGEPTLLPYLSNLIKYAFDKYQMKCCVITNGLCGINTIDKLLMSGVDDFLLSIEGMAATHNFLSCVTDARKRQIDFINHLIINDISFRINTVINKYNQNELYEMSKWFISLKGLRIVNFINFNPHHEWKKDKKGTKKIIADFDIVIPQLDSAIDILEMNNIGVNVRYFPMCKVLLKHRKNICNDLHVIFDPYEWDYCLFPKTPEKALHWSITGSQSTEYKRFPCSTCNLLYICGGVNKAFYDASGKDCVFAIKEDIKDKYYFYKYRQENELTLERRA